MPPKKRTTKSAAKSVALKKKVTRRTTKTSTKKRMPSKKKVVKKTTKKKALKKSEQVGSVLGGEVALVEELDLDVQEVEDRDFEVRELKTEESPIDIVDEESEDEDRGSDVEESILDGDDTEEEVEPQEKDDDDMLDIFGDEVDGEETVLDLDAEKRSKKDIRKEKKMAKKVKKEANKKIKKIKKPIVVEEENEEEVGSVLDGEDIDTQLTQIYENVDGSMPDMHTFEKRPRAKLIRAFFILISSLAFFAAVAWIGLFIIQPKNNFSEDDVILSISGDEEVKVGQEVTYRIRYRNSQGVSLNDAGLEVRYPNGFQFITSSIAPSNENNDMWKLDDIDPQGGDFIDITGRVYGNLDQKQSLRAFLNYTPANFSSQFQKVTHIEVVTNESILKVGMELPEEVALSSEVPILITITPEEKVEHITVSCDGDIFTVKTKATPDMDEGEDCSWSFDVLEEEQTISFSGSFISQDKIDTSHLMLTIRGWDDEIREGDGYILAQVDTQVVLVQKSTTFNLAINGGISTLTAQPGESLNTSIILKNSGDVVLRDVEVQMVWEAPSYQNRSLLAWPDIDIPNDADIFGDQISETIRRGVVSWDSRYIPELAEIMPGEEIKIDMMIPIRDNIQTTLANFEEAVIRGVAEIRYNTGGEPEMMTSNEIVIDVLSDLDLEVRDEIGENVDGPLHTVTWLLSNSFHELTDIKIEADIYGDVVLNVDDFVVPAGDLTYDAESQHMTWTIDKIPVGLDVLATQFAIVLMKENPSQSQLMSKVKVNAYDTVAQKSVILVGDEVLLSYEDVVE